MPGDDELVSIPDAARELDMTRAALWRYVKAGRLPAKRYGRDWLVRRADLNHFKSIPRRPGPKPRPSSSD